MSATGISTTPGVLEAFRKLHEVIGEEIKRDEAAQYQTQLLEKNEEITKLRAQLLERENQRTEAEAKAEEQFKLLRDKNEEEFKELRAQLSAEEIHRKAAEAELQQAKERVKLLQDKNKETDDRPNKLQQELDKRAASLGRAWRETSDNARNMHDTLVPHPDEAAKFAGDLQKKIWDDAKIILKCFSYKSVQDPQAIKSHPELASTLQTITGTHSYLEHLNNRVVGRFLLHAIMSERITKAYNEPTEQEREWSMIVESTMEECRASEMESDYFRHVFNIIKTKSQKDPKFQACLSAEVRVRALDLLRMISVILTVKNRAGEPIDAISAEEIVHPDLEHVVVILEKLYISAITYGITMRQNRVWPRVQYFSHDMPWDNTTMETIDGSENRTGGRRMLTFFPAFIYSFVDCNGVHATKTVHRSREYIDFTSPVVQNAAKTTLQTEAKDKKASEPAASPQTAAPVVHPPLDSSTHSVPKASTPPPPPPAAHTTPLPTSPAKTPSASKRKRADSGDDGDDENGRSFKKARSNSETPVGSASPSPAQEIVDPTPVSGATEASGNRKRSREPDDEASSSGSPKKRRLERGPSQQPPPEPQSPEHLASQPERQVVQPERAPEQPAASLARPRAKGSKKQAKPRFIIHNSSGKVVAAKSASQKEGQDALNAYHGKYGAWPDKFPDGVFVANAPTASASASPQAAEPSSPRRTRSKSAKPKGGN